MPDFTRNCNVDDVEAQASELLDSFTGRLKILLKFEMSFYTNQTSIRL